MKIHNANTQEDHTKDIPPPEKDNNPLALTFDPEDFKSFLEDCDLTDDEATEFLHVMWNIVVQFVDLGFQIHPLQQACGQDQEKSLKPALTAPDGLYLDHINLCGTFESAGSCQCFEGIPERP